MAVAAIGHKYDIEKLRYEFHWPKPWRYFEILNLIFFYIKSSRDKTLVIRNLETCLWPSRANAIYLVFHVDWYASGFFSKLIQIWTWTVFRFFTPKDQPVVVISKYWKDFLKKKGFTNIHLIYCAFDSQNYNINDDEVESFLQSNNLENKKIVYIGNPQFKKGADIAYEALKGTDVELVCSGEGDLDIPVRRLKLNFKDYLCLLKASTVVVTLSRFKEGWNRVAHEALLVGTAVIGSGRGGMGELLESTGQKIIDVGNLTELKSLIQSYLNEKPTLPLSTFDYVRSFDTDRFQKEWIKLIDISLNGVGKK